MNNKTITAIILVLTMLAVPWAGMLDGPELEQKKGPAWATGSATASADTALNMSSPNSTHGNDANLNLTNISGMDSKVILTFPITSPNGPVTSSGSIESATLTIYRTSGMGQGSLYAYAAPLETNYDEGNATWFNKTNNTTWQLPGAYGANDSGQWEPRSSSFAAGSSSISLNVTSIAQQALASNNTEMDFIVSILGMGMITIASSEHPTTAKRPSVTFVYAIAPPASGSAIVKDSPADGSAPQTGAFLLTADTTPTLGWTGLNGTGVEIQISKSSNFRDFDDEDWHFTSWSTSGFSMSGANGTYTIPSGSSLDMGMPAYWRIRASKTNQLSDWQMGHFIVPFINATNNGNSTATFELYRDSLAVDSGTIHDAWLLSGSPNLAGGATDNMWVGNSNNTSRDDMAVMLHVDLDQTGLHSNATILSAYMNLRRTDRQGDAWISIHQYEQTNWSEDDATWNNATANQNWDAGQLLKGMGHSLDVQNGNKSGPTFSFDVTSSVQEYLRGVYQGNTDDGISYLLQSAGANNEWARFAGSEEPAMTYRPKMVITYAWGDGQGPTDTVTVQSPLDGQGVWSIVNNNNLTADLTPTLNWSSTGHTTDDVRIEFAGNKDFTEGPLYRIDSRDSNSGINKSTGTFDVPSTWGVDYGEDYYWRVRWVDDGDWGDFDSTRGFFVSSINSTWVSNNTWEFRLRHSNASNTIDEPYCGDTYIDSLGPNSNNDQGELSITSSQYTLFGCNTQSHNLPSGLAVVDAELRMKTSFVTGTVDASAYGLNNHLWKEDEATWENYNANGNWSIFGAGGNDRGQLLDSETISSSSNWITWNVTTAVQNSMRWNVPSDFVVMGIGSGQAAMYDKENAGSAADYPELVITYRPGSMAVPDPPTLTSPINGVWSVTTGMLIAPEERPTLTWNHTGSIPANGWVVELDTAPTFDSNNLSIARSWVQINDFDATNRTYTPASNLTTSQVWYWRVRGSSQTNQLGNWSMSANFVVPNIESGSIDANNSYIIIRPGAAVAAQSIPSVPDTWITSGANRNQTHSTSNTLVVGCESGECPKTAMLSFPLSELPQPSNSRIVGAELGLWAFSVNTTISGDAPRISVHRTMRNWNGSANGLSWNGDNSNNSTSLWSQQGGIGSGDIGPISDIGSPTASAWFNLNVTEIVHNTITDGDTNVNMTLRSDTNAYSEAMFYGSDYTWSSSRPVLKLWYRNGTGTAASVTPTLAWPNNGEITWDNSGHALGSDPAPILKWTQPNSSSYADDWRLFIYNDTSDVRDGYQIFDSRYDTGFNIGNFQYQTWTPPSNFTYDAEQRWFVQTIKDDIYGERSSSFTFNVPNALGYELNSTDARLRVNEGGALTSQALPVSFADTYLDSYQSTTNRGNNALMSVGRSPSTFSSSYYSWSVIRINISSLPVPNPWEVISADLELYCSNCATGTGNSVVVTAHQLLSDFDEMQATHNQRYTNSSWPNPAVGGVVDSITVMGTGWYGWNITQLMQAARSRGDDTVLIALQGSSTSGTIVKQFHSSEFSNIQLRPVLNITHRIGTQWIPSDATNPVPGSTSTLWQPGEARPTGRNPVVVQWSHPSPSNVTSWQIQLSSDARYMPSTTNSLDSSDSMTYDGTFTTNPLSYAIDTQDLPPGWSGWPDAWLYWRIRPVIGDSLGNWTDGGEFRVPADQGSDDGLGNHTVTMYRGSVFSTSGMLPTIPDTWIDSTPNAGTTTPQSTNTTLAVGNSPFQSGQESVALIQFDLGELPFPQTMLATTVSLRMYRAGYSVSGSATVAIHECNSFSETSTWSTFSLSTNCNSTAASTLSQSNSGFGGTWYDWDVTSIVQAAGYNGTISMAIRATNYTGYLQFASSETGSASYRPQLVIGYVDNQNGTTPPVTPVLSWPTDQQVIYSISQYDDFLLDAPVRPSLSWNDAGDTSGYIVRMWNSTISNMFNSWNTTSSQGTFNNTAGTASFTPGWDLEEGGVYYWNIQGINGSILGPRSSTWAFAIGNPNTQSLGNNIWTATFQEGNDVEEFNHPLVGDTYISEGNPSTNYQTDSLKVGEGCTGGPSSSEMCSAIIQIDLSQIPLTGDSRAHSGRLAVWVDSTDSPTSTWIDITAYALLNGNFAEDQANWQQASLGNNWATAGMGAGSDISTIALGTARVSSTTSGWVYFDISGALAANVNGTFSIALIGSAEPVPTVTAQFTATFASSESTNTVHRPTLVFNYTSVFDISLTGAATTTADTAVQMTATLQDVDNTTISGTVEWTTSNGVIDSNGLFTPDQTGNVTIQARFGRVIVSHVIIVQPGLPQQLIGGPAVSEITSDETVSLWFEVLDDNNNLVPGVALSFAITNGSILQGNSHTTPVGAITYMPWNTGIQWVNVSWSGGSLSLQVTVTEGAPDYIVMSGYSSIPAGETRDFNWTAYDAHDNPVTPIRLLSVNWTVEDGNITQVGGYTADKVGFWNVTLNTGYGLSVSQNVETTHGAIYQLEVNATANALTADDEITIETVRIDIRGNRLNITLPASAWVISNGTLFEESPVRWTPWAAATQSIDATLEGLTTRIIISVTHGEAVGVDIRTTSGDTLTSGDSGTIDAYNYDQYGNEWIGAIETWVINEPMADQNWLIPSSAYADFEAVTVGTWTITATYIHQETTAMTDSISFTVEPGPLASIILTGHGSQLTADDSLALNPITRDQNSNFLTTDMLRWFIWDATSPTAQPPACIDWGNELTTTLQANGHEWEAAEEGTWIICAISGSYQTTVEVTVSHGVAAVLYHVESANTLVAGASISIEITAADSDGNVFAIDVAWDGSPASDFTDEAEMGVYSWHGTTVGSFSLEYTYADLTGIWGVSVTPSTLETLEMTISPSLTVAQQSTITIDVDAFDAFGNEIDVPDSAVVYHGGEQHIVTKKTNSQWQIYMLDAGESEVTVVAEEKYDSEKVMVEQTVLGFFEEGGTLYYIGAGLLVLALMGVIATLVVLLRKAGYDDEDEYDELYDDVEGGYDDGDAFYEGGYDEPVTDSGYGGEEETHTDSGSEEGEQDISVDEDGTEWWEDDQGVWYYRSVDMDDWEVWEE